MALSGSQLAYRAGPWFTVSGDPAIAAKAAAIVTGADLVFIDRTTSFRFRSTAQGAFDLVDRTGAFTFKPGEA